MESLIILKAHNGQLPIKPPRELTHLLVGAMLMELMLSQQIEPHPNTVRFPEELTIRITGDMGIDEIDQETDEAADRIRSQQRPRTVAYWIDSLSAHFGSLASNYVRKLVSAGLLIATRDGYDVRSDRDYQQVRGMITELMEYRDANQEPPLRHSVLGALYWAPADYINYCFGESLEAYNNKQACSSILLAMRKLK